MKTPMQCDMVNSSVINLGPKEAIEFVKREFVKNFSLCEIIEENSMMGYWNLKFLLEHCVVFFEGDIGGVFTVWIIINNETISLWDYDKDLKYNNKTNTENLIKHINILKLLFENQ